MRVNVLLLVDILDAKEVSTFRRSRSIRYHLKKNLKGFPDAKACSFDTLGLGERTVYFWLIDHADDGLPRKPTERQQAARDPAKIESATEFFQILPKMPFHYCRSSSSKEYLEAMFNDSEKLSKNFVLLSE